MAKTITTIAKDIIHENFGFAKNKITDVVVNHTYDFSTHEENILSIDFYVNDMQFCCAAYEGTNEWSLHIVDSKKRIQFGFHEQCCRCRYHR